MMPLQLQVADFLSQPRLAVVGVSDERETPANAICRRLKEAGHTVYVVHPHLATFDGAPCYTDVTALPEPVGGVMIVTRPEVTEQVVRQCIDAGIPRVWMHNVFGTCPARLLKGPAAKVTSVSEEAVRLCRAHGIAVIPGACPMMFCEPVDGGHRFIRGVLKMTGSLTMDAPEALPA